jgi:hypothetical protein
MKLVILHEGNEKKTNDNQLIRLLMESLNLNLEFVTFIGMGTKSNFFKAENYPEFLINGANKTIDKILFIVDADYEYPNKKNPEEHNPTGGYENTQNALNEMIAELGFQEISSTYIMCDPITKNGYLESFILSTIPPAQKVCIENFLACSHFKSKENHKAILKQVYNMAYPKKEGEEKYYFEHSHFDSLKEKLCNLFTTDL